MPLVPVGAATVTEFPDTVVTVCVAPPLMLYLKVNGAVPRIPVKVTSGELLPLQTLVAPLIVPVTSGLTVTVTDPDCV